MAPTGKLTACRLESERLVLEPLTPAHAEELAPVLDDVALHDFTGGTPEGLQALRARFERWSSREPTELSDAWLNWAIRQRATGDAVGTMQATVLAAESWTVAEAALVIGTAHQHKGFAKEAATATAAWLEQNGVQAIRARIHPDHRASMAVARSLGLRPTPHRVSGEIRWSNEPQ